ncbi:MAG TPA: hypothetical protein VLA93_22665 [Pyrinomonadaceae bacterium]|nr:hypothetical protein [Pyrinomonadaceae bacterium]
MRKPATCAMRPLVIVLLIFAAVLGFSLSCSPKYGPLQLTGPIGAVHFPDPWIKVVGNSERGVNDNVGYVVRKSAGELIFAIKQGFAGEQYGLEISDFPVRHADYDYYSDNRFAVGLDGAFRIRKATTEEWDAAEKPVHSYYFIRSFLNKQHTNEAVQYKGKLFRKSGESWTDYDALVSPRGTWIAVFSYSSRDKPDPGWLPGLGGGGEPGRGEVFLDIYNVSSGAKVISARSPFGAKPGGFVPSMLFGSSVWVEDRYLIMPLNWWLEDCLVAVLPGK